MGGWFGAGLGLWREDKGGGNGEFDAVFREGAEDAAAEFAEDAVALVSAYTDIDGVGDFAAGDAIDAGYVGVGEDDVFEGLVGTDLGGEPLEQGEDTVRVFGRAYGEGEGGDGVVAGHVGDGRDAAVGNDVEGAISVSKLGAAEGEVFDGALEASDSDGIANRKLVLEEDKDAVEHVFEQGLRAEADAQTDDAGGGDEGTEGKVDGAENFHDEVEAEETIGACAYDSGDGTQLGGAAAVANQGIGAAAEAMREEENEALGDEGNQERDEDLGEAFLHELKQIGVPAVLDGEQGMFFLWHDGW